MSKQKQSSEVARLHKKIMDMEPHRLYCTTCEALGRDRDHEAASYEPDDPWDQPGADEYDYDEDYDFDEAYGE